MASTTHKTVIAFSTSLVVVVIGYFIYDRMRDPCESIFEQAKTNLNAKIEILKTGGAVSIGNDKIQDLSERSQMMALNLKTCCIVFDGGRLNSGEFLKCKQGVERYQTQVTQVINIVADAQVARTESKPQLVEERLKEANQAAVQAAQTAAGYQKEVAQITSKAPTTPAREQTAIGGSESEPNNSAFEANVLGGGSTIGEITESKESDWFLLRPGSNVRDWLVVSLENRSQTLTPYMLIYDKDKNKIGEQLAGTQGANLEHRMVVAPGSELYVQVGSRGGYTSGGYALTWTLRKTYDEFEPNDDSFSAKPIGVGTAIDANVMDGPDVDWYVLKGFPSATMKIRLENRSSQLVPWIHIYDRNKKLIHETLANNGGESLDVALKVAAGDDHFVALGSRGGYTSGEYRLTVAPGN